LHSNIGRVYYTGQFENNVFVYSNPPAGSNVTSVLVGQQSTPGPNQDVPADPYELAVTASNNSQILPSSFTSQGWDAVISVVTGTVNGSSTAQTIELPATSNPGAVNLAPYYDQVGFTSDNATGPGNLDGGGYSYSSNAIGGTIVDWVGVPFTLGPVGQNDVVEAYGQTIPLPSGNYTALYLLGTAVQGLQSGTFTFNYTDGSTSQWTQQFSDWASHSSNTGEYVVETMPYRNYSQNNGFQSVTMYLYGYSMPVTTGKTLESVTLPSDSDIKILAMDLIAPQSQIYLGSQYNLDGLSSNDNTNLGNMDGGYNSYSIAALGGETVAWGGVTFNLGPVGASQTTGAGLANAVSATGQSILVSQDAYTALKVLATGVNGAQSGQFTVYYTDGSSTQFSQSFSDWAANSSESGETVVETMGYRNDSPSGGNGRDTRTMYVYGYSFPLNSSKLVSSITLPNDGSIKILAMDLVYQPSQVSLSNNYNIVGITSDTATSQGNLDGNGNSYSSNALGGETVAWGSNSYNLGPIGTNNVVQATGQTILLQPGNYSTLSFLATAANYAEAGTFTINYSDGTSTVITQNFSMWSVNDTQVGETVVKQMSYYNASNGFQVYQTRYLYGYKFALNPAKTILSITLPNNSDIKILAMDLS